MLYGNIIYHKREEKYMFGGCGGVLNKDFETETIFRKVTGNPFKWMPKIFQQAKPNSM